MPTADLTSKSISFRTSPDLIQALREVIAERPKHSISEYVRSLVLADLGRRRLDKDAIRRSQPRSIYAGRHHPEKFLQ